MITIDKLKAYGANVSEGLGRCFNNEAFYLRLVDMGLADKNFDKLKTSLAEGDTEAAFEAAHAFKGAMGNLALTPLYDPISELTELLRGQTGPIRADALLEEIMMQLGKARALQED